ncbi:hypothetical protein IDJ77_11185 [Mucilaginibacter sp. ZT4R22]|uniref:DUF5977 domain-containing protein n=1 Tax=Mucilaginibacter pankratovii TaxID=2772110 RepID=A0ABR7WS74_9SPHI|nr:DUF5977 domain-containing protein [Mucilaginibacter pankratovii]MBD1364372.1 hypothetical protein [Mucilaginibacter pankratovii]
MGVNKGTLIGAPVRPNDSNDEYAAAFQSEIKGGHHTRATLDERDNIGNWLREAGMTCYVTANGNTYKLANDLVTWVQSGSATGGSTLPGSGGESGTIQLISGNFGAWAPIGSYNEDIVDQLELCFKTDLVAFPTRAVTYLQGQFSLDAEFEGTTITLGTLPANSRPKAQLKKYLIANNIELFLVIETNGDVKLLSKDGLNLPAGETTQPFYIDTFYNPDITTETPTEYTATRSNNFTRNTCGEGYHGTSVLFTKTYTSTVDQATADMEAANDTAFDTEGQAFANEGDNAACVIDGGGGPTVSTISVQATIKGYYELTDGTADLIDYLVPNVVKEIPGSFGDISLQIITHSVYGYTPVPVRLLVNGDIIDSDGDITLTDLEEGFTVIIYPEGTEIE